ncbi:hypothetical protein TIFTF001_044563 [Ficus carica]|uniref:Uncharacterized protein n=1 Tax=Ficus carica TaxID=3494 RepID=A0AA87ZAA2_FICCA|nr:hypothetical protein TIFTF001_044563 [Ficus carica]
MSNTCEVMELRLFLSEFFDAICVTDCATAVAQSTANPIRVIPAQITPSPPANPPSHPVIPAQTSSPALPPRARNPSSISGQIFSRPVSSAKQPSSSSSWPSAISGRNPSSSSSWLSASSGPRIQPRIQPA